MYIYRLSDQLFFLTGHSRLDSRASLSYIRAASDRNFQFQCSTHRDGTAMGILCEPLCAEKGIHSLACETLHAGKEAVFSAHWEATRLVFKASR